MSTEQAYNVRIEGMDPGLLMHRFTVELQAESISAVSKGGKAQLSPEEQAESVAYRDRDGELFLSSLQVHAALVKGGTGHLVKGKAKLSYKARMKALVAITPANILHGQKEFEIYSCPVVINRARVVRHRPWLPEWSVEFELLNLDAELLPEDVLHESVIDAGRLYGVGDFRPHFGRFRVPKFERA